MTEQKKNWLQDSSLTAALPGQVTVLPWASVLSSVR